MSLYEHHIFICINERPVDNPKGCCLAKGASKVLETFRLELEKRGLKAKVRANKAGCLNQCAQGPSVVIYPEGKWFSKVTPADVPTILDQMESSA